MRAPIFILSHGRANNVKTLKELRRQKVDRDIYIVIDDEDEQGEEYLRNFGDMCIRFSKKEAIKKTDSIAPASDRARNVVVYARNAVFDIAKNLGAEYFIVLDDDYSRYEYVDSANRTRRKTNKLNDILNALETFARTSGAECVSIGQAGVFLGGAESTLYFKKFRRQLYNFFLFDANCEERFRGVLNEDLTYSVDLCKRGRLALQFNGVALKQEQTQKQPGGLTPAYKKHGTYAKSEYSVVAHPDCVAVKMLNSAHPRVHHVTNWRKAAATKILREEYGRNIEG